MSTVSDRIAAMDNFQIVRFFEAFAQQLMASSDTPFDAVTAGVPSTTRSLPAWSDLADLTPEQAETPLDVTVAAPIARRILTTLATDATFGPALESFSATFRDDALVAEVILAVGLVASLLMMVASTSFKAKFGNVEIEKHTVDAESIKAILEPLAKLIPDGKA